MRSSTRLFSTELIFGIPQNHWYHLCETDLESWKIPAHLVDQVFRASVCSVQEEHLHFFEFFVSEQFPKESYSHLIRIIKRKSGTRAIISFFHRNSFGVHLAILSKEMTYHLDIDLSHLSDFDKRLLDRIRAAGSRRYENVLLLMRRGDTPNRLFRRLRIFLERFPRTHIREHRNLVDLLLKLLFLVFIQKKGWLNFDPYYLERRMGQCHRRGLSILHLFLKPLFARLNGTKIAEPIPLGNLPVLGGGMFQFQPEYLPPIDNQTLIELFDDVLTDYSFTLFEEKEDSAPMGITPEVLGTVFENLMDHGERKANGVFFTPSHIARKQVAASFEALFSNGCIDDQKLNEIRILDPSCGSGTYLVAAFQYLLARRIQNVPQHERYNGHLYRLKSNIVLNNLFGMDIHPLAVRLTEVRLWLNMIQDLEIGSPDQAPELPHLQHHIRCGDFLAIPTSWRAESLRKWPKYGHYQKLKKKFMNSRKRQSLLNHLVRLEREWEAHLIQSEQDDFTDRMKTNRAQQTLPGLVDVHTEANKPKSHEFRGYSKKNESDSLGPHVAFCGEMMEGGFDLIIGNPPWLSSKKIPKPQKEQARKLLHYQAGFVAHGQLDLSLYFAVLSLSFLKRHGHLSLLLPGKLLQAQYGAGFRQLIAQRHHLAYLFDYGLESGFLFQADTFPVVLGVNRKNETQKEVYIERQGQHTHENYDLAPHFFQTQGGAWLVPPKCDLQLLTSSSKWQTLGEIGFKPKRGLVTGNKRRFIFETQPAGWPKRWFQRLIRGRDLQDQNISSARWILYPFNRFGRINQKDVKGLMALLKTKDLAKPSTLIPYRPLESISENAPSSYHYRVIWRYLDAELRAWLLHDEIKKTDTYQNWIPDQTTYFLDFQSKTDALRIFYLLNSAHAKTWIRSLAERGKDRYLFLYAQTIRELRVPPNLFHREPSLDLVSPTLLPKDAHSIAWT